MLQAIELGIPGLLLFLTIIILFFLELSVIAQKKEQSEKGKIQFSIRSFDEQYCDQ